MRNTFDYSNVQPHTIPTPPGAAVSSRKIFSVDGYGSVPVKNSIWNYCKDLRSINELQVGEETVVAFQNVVGVSERRVLRQA